LLALIGMGFATKYPEKIKSIVFLNTAAFRSQEIPTSISICKIPWIGEKIVRGFNAFAWPATFMAVKNKLSNTIKKGYLLPYDNFENRIATARFVKDIPLNKDHPTYPTLLEIETRLQTVTCPKMFLWGAQDFCFTTNFLDKWKEFYPNAETKIYKDEKDDILEETKKFFNRHSETLH